MQPLADFIDQYGMTPFMLASAILWADKPLDDDIHRDISFNDSEQELDERAMWIVNEICENGFADTRLCPYIGHTSGDTYKMLGVGLRSKRIDGHVCSVRVVIDEDRFAPYRERYEQELEESRLPLLEDLPVPEAQTDMERRVVEDGEIVNVKAPEGFKFHKEPTDPDNPKAVRNWKNGKQEDVVEIGQGDVYAVIPQPGSIVIDMDAPRMTTAATDTTSSDPCSPRPSWCIRRRTAASTPTIGFPKAGQANSRTPTMQTESPSM